MAGAVSAKHTIKRARRFTCNRCVEVHWAMAVVKELTRRRKKPLIVSFDWNDVGDFYTLMAAACIGGRAVPLVWVSTSGASLRRSHYSLEERTSRKLRKLIPRSAPVAILAGRGSGRAEWPAVCPERKLLQVVRIKPDVAISSARYRGVLKKCPTKKGMAPPAQGRRMPHGPAPPAQRPDPLAASPAQESGRAVVPDDRPGQKGRAALLTLWPADEHRGAVPRRQEQVERPSLRDTKIGKPNRFDRFLLVVALAYLVLVGLRAKLDFNPSAW